MDSSELSSAEQNHYDYIDDYYYESNSDSNSESDSDSDSDSDSSTSNASNSVRTRPDDAVWSRRKGSAVMLEGYVDGADLIEGGSDGGGSLVVGRTKSLTDDDLEELKGCLDLGFGFSYDEIPELCSTLPALELCYSMSQRFLDEKRLDGDGSEVGGGAGGSVASACSSPSRNAIANWKISEPGDDPEEVKARLKYWAQAVACTVKLCNN